MKVAPLQAETGARAEEECEEVAPLEDECEGRPMLESKSLEVEAHQRRRATMRR